MIHYSVTEASNDNRAVRSIPEAFARAIPSLLSLTAAAVASFMTVEGAVRGIVS